MARERLFIYGGEADEPTPRQRVVREEVRNAATHYASEIADLIRQSHSEYVRASQLRDREFPDQLVKAIQAGSAQIESVHG